MKAYDIKKGNVVEHNGSVYQVRDIERSAPQGRGGPVKFRLVLMVERVLPVVAGGTATDPLQEGVGQDFLGGHGGPLSSW